MPYTSKGLNFVPQLFYKVLMLPFGIQSTQIHINYWKEKDFENFVNFIEKNNRKVITLDKALNKINNSFFYKLINFLSEKILKFIRIFKN